jgi:hypothetical protein
MIEMGFSFRPAGRQRRRRTSGRKPQNQNQQAAAPCGKDRRKTRRGESATVSGLTAPIIVTI